MKRNPLLNKVIVPLSAHRIQRRHIGVRPGQTERVRQEIGGQEDGDSQRERERLDKDRQEGTDRMERGWQEMRGEKQTEGRETRVSRDGDRHRELERE